MSEIKILNNKLNKYKNVYNLYRCRINFLSLKNNTI